MRDLLGTIMKCLRRSLGWQQPSSKPSPQMLDVSDLKLRSHNGTAFGYKTLDMPPQMSDLEWVTTADLAGEILRRCDVGVISLGFIKTDEKHTVEVYTKGSLAQKLILVKRTQEFLIEVGADE